MKQEQKQVLVKRGKTVSVKEIKNVNEGSEFFLLPEQITKIEESCDSLQDYVIILLLSRCGLRRTEVAHLRIEEVDFKTVSSENSNGWLNLHYTKGSVERKVPIDRTTLTGIKQFVGKRKTGFVFIGKNKVSCISNRAINFIVEKISKKAGVVHPDTSKKRVNPHIFRHSFARNWLKGSDKGAGRLECLQKVLGHANINTTIAIYGKPSLNDLQDEYNKVREKKVVE